MSRVNSVKLKILAKSIEDIHLKQQPQQQQQTNNKRANSPAGTDLEFEIHQMHHMYT